MTFQISDLSRRRLTTLADFLDAIPKKVFDLRSWADSSKDEGLKPITKRGQIVAGVGPKEMISCNTTACAAGWAATIPKFRKAGLRLKVDTFDKAIAEVTFTRRNGDESSGFRATTNFFDLPGSVVSHIFFSPEEYPGEGRRTTPKQVATRIRSYLKNPERLLSEHDIKVAGDGSLLHI